MGRAVQIMESLRGCRKVSLVRVAIGCTETCAGVCGVKTVGVQLSSGVEKAKKKFGEVEPVLFMSLKEPSLSCFFWEPL